MRGERGRQALPYPFVRVALRFVAAGILFASLEALRFALLRPNYVVVIYESVGRRDFQGRMVIDRT